MVTPTNHVIARAEFKLRRAPGTVTYGKSGPGYRKKVG